MDEHRVERVSEALREELYEIVGFELEDPRLGGVEVTEVHVSPDSRHARVKVALEGGEREQQRALTALDHARHYLRQEVARRLRLRKIPELHFEPDPWSDAPARVELLLRRAKKKRGPAENES